MGTMNMEQLKDNNSIISYHALLLLVKQHSRILGFDWIDGVATKEVLFYLIISVRTANLETRWCDFYNKRERLVR